MKNGHTAFMSVFSFVFFFLSHNFANIALLFLQESRFFFPLIWFSSLNRESVSKEGILEAF